MNDRNTEVLEQYDMEIFSVRRGRGSWICETDKGLRLLGSIREPQSGWSLRRRC